MLMDPGLSQMGAQVLTQPPGSDDCLIRKVK